MTGDALRLKLVVTTFIVKVTYQIFKKLGASVFYLICDMLLL